MKRGLHGRVPALGFYSRLLCFFCLVDENEAERPEEEKSR